MTSTVEMKNSPESNNDSSGLGESCNTISSSKDKDSRNDLHDEENNGKHYNKKEDADLKSLKNKRNCICGVWHFIQAKLSLGKKGATPLNWKHAGLVIISMFASAVSLTFLFPFLPEMVLYFGYKEEDKGYYAGLVASAMFGGRMCGCYFWGWLSDKVGRRPVMLITIFGNGFFSLMFGFTINIQMAIALRFGTGLVNGTVGTVLAMLYEICDNTNQAVGMAMMSVAWGAGIILGPAIGGILASPAKNFPHVFPIDGLFGKFPYLLPAAIIFCICCLVVLIDFFFLPETLASKKKDVVKLVDGEKGETEPLHVKTDKEQLGQASPIDNVHGKYSVESLPTMIALSVEDLHDESASETYKMQRRALLQDKTGNDIPLNGKKSLSHHDIPSAHCDFRETKSGSTTDVMLLKDGNQIAELNKTNGKEEERTLSPKGCWAKWFYRIKNTSFVSLLSVPDVRMAVTLCSLLSFGAIGFDEIFTVWASTDRRLDGLSFHPREIGAVLGLSFLPVAFLNLYLFPFLVSKFSSKKTFIWCSLFTMVTIAGIPTLHLINISNSTMIILILICLIPSKIFASCAMSASALFINNSSPPGKTGSVNGIAMTCTAFTRTLAPLIGGSIYSWTMSYGSPVLGPPFDVNLSFVMFGTIIWINGVYSVYLNEKLNKQTKK